MKYRKKNSRKQKKKTSWKCRQVTLNQSGHAAMKKAATKLRWADAAATMDDAGLKRSLTHFSLLTYYVV